VFENEMASEHELASNVLLGMCEEFVDAHSGRRSGRLPQAAKILVGCSARSALALNGR
jgi:hypothetical protein